MKKLGVIFDMDGVVSDTQKFHAEVESRLLEEFNIQLSPEEITKRFSGVADDVMFQQIFDENGKKDYPPIDSIVFRKWNMMAEIAKGRITAIPHAIELIRTLKANDFKLAIASASTLVFIHEVIDELDVASSFDTLVSAQEVDHGKPSPDVFLLAAERLQLEPEACIVIEDGRSGMLGAKAANMKCIGLVSDTQESYPSTVTVTSLKEVTIPLIHRL
ncbi:MAG TPA: HAD family phosphatase [Candidatus Saccharimonadales bacterium]